MKRLLIALILLAGSAFATTYQVGSGQTYATIQTCATAMAAGDTCNVHAGTYAENVTVTAGTVGNYKTITVNGSDIVTVNGTFTLGSHVKLVGNCPALQGTLTMATCGFFVQSLTGGGGACLTIGSVTDAYVVDNAFYACGGSGQIEISQSATFIYIQGNTLSYAATTQANANLNENHSINTNGNHILIEGNDMSHYGLGVMFQGEYTIIRNNSFHDQYETEAGSNHHTDAIFTEPWEDGLSSGTNQFAVIEGNTHMTAVGSNAKGFLFQADSCSGSPCNHAIVRFNVGAHIGSTYTTDDNSFSSVPGWSYVKEYNNTWADIHMTTGTGGSTYTNYYMSHSTNPADLNSIFYFPGAVSSYNPYASDSTTDATFNYGHALLYCGGGCSNIFGHLYNSGSFTSDPGNQIADPKFISYAGNNFHLQSGSPAIAAGTYLTTVASGDSGSGTSLVVTDTSYFQDGYGLANANSTVSGDCISVTTVSNHVCITAVVDATHLTLASGISRSNGDHVWLYSKSDGTKVLTGSAPDLGALPYQSPSASIPIVYYARTDVAAQPYPVTIPCPGPSCGSALGTLTGANYQFTPTDFPTPYVRITDGSTPATNNLGFTTAGSASSEVNLWGPDSDFFIITQKGGFSDIFKFNTTTNAATYVASSNTIGSTTEASHIPHSHIVYAIKPCPAATTGCSQYDLVIWQYDLTGLTGWPTPTIVADLTTACGFTSYSGAAFIADPSTSLDDQTFSTAVCTSGTCAQDQAGAQYAVSWNRTNGCSYLNTLTDQVYDNGTLLGAVSGLSGAFTLHNARGSGDGQHIRMTPTVSYGFNQLQVWQPFTLNGTFSNSGDSCGHVCSGTLHIFNKCTGTYLNGMGEMPFSNLSAWTSLAAIYPSPDQADSAHITCASMNSTDTNPFALIMAMPTATYPTYAWDNELLAQATDGTGRTWRFGHTFSTVALQNLLPAAISQDGKYLLWQSDWMDMFGCTNGTSVGCGVLEPDWATGAYTTASRITPLTGNAGGYTYQPTGSCTASGSQPAWTQTIGSTSADSGCTWTNIGQARTDVMLAILPTQQNPNPATNLMVKVGQIETKALLGGSE